MTTQPKWYRSPVLPEAIFVVAIFLLTMVQQWIRIDTFLGFLKGVVFFLIIYSQAHFHRVFVFPLLTKRKYIQYAAITTVTLLLGAIILYVANRYWIAPQYYNKSNHVAKVLYLLAISATSIMSIMAVYIARQYQTELHKRNQDQILLNEMQIKLLHAQLNPHFFFNMLNNIYGVSLTTPERTPDLLMKLSKLMRYQLETGNKTTVNVADELAFINNYIILEKERIGKRCEITFVHPQPIEVTRMYSIAPLILITLVENAFKHSVTVTNKWFVTIDMSLQGITLRMTIVNSLPDASLQNESTGIGLHSVRQRLQLLYNDHHTFESGVVGNAYRTELTIDLIRS